MGKRRHEMELMKGQMLIGAGKIVDIETRHARRQETKRCIFAQIKEVASGRHNIAVSCLYIRSACVCASHNHKRNLEQDAKHT
jgi:hypothetical protein